MDEFSEKFRRGGGGVIFNPKNYIADFCHYRYFGHEFRKKLQYDFPKMRGGEVELFRKFIRFGGGRLPLDTLLTTLIMLEAESY